MNRAVILAGAVAFLAGLVAGPGWAASVTAAASSVVILTAGWLRSRRSAPVPSAVADVWSAMRERS